MNESKDWIFYHALYTLITHWAAFIACIGLLATIGVVISTVTGPLKGIRRLFCQCSILMISIGAGLFNWRMYTYSVVVDNMLPPKYIQQLSLMGATPTTALLGAGATAILAVFCSLILWVPDLGMRKPK